MATGCLDGGPRGGADRRAAKGGADPDPAPHSYICAPARHPLESLLAVNKIDLVEFSAEVFPAHRCGISRLPPSPLNFAQVVPIPPVGTLRRQCHRAGRSALPWYDGATLLDHPRVRRGVAENRPPALAACASPVQWVNRPNLDFRGFRPATVASGRVPAVGDHVVVAASGKDKAGSPVSSPSMGDRDSATARRRPSTLTLGRLRSTIARGDVLSAPAGPAGGRRPVRRPCAVDERGAAAAGPLLPAAHSATQTRLPARVTHASSTRSTSTPWSNDPGPHP